MRTQKKIKCRKCHKKTNKCRKCCKKTKQKGKYICTGKCKISKKTKQKGGKKTGKVYTVTVAWNRLDDNIWYIQNAPVRKKTSMPNYQMPILDLNEGDKIELRSEKPTKIDTYTCVKKRVRKWTSTMAGPQMVDIEDCYKLGGRNGIWIKVKQNSSEVGWILASLLKTHMKEEKKTAKSKKSKRSKSRSRNRRSRSRSRSSEDVFHSAEEGPRIDLTGALQPHYERSPYTPLPAPRPGLHPDALTGALQPHSERSPYTYWHPRRGADVYSSNPW